jgi:hypothetical protein
MASDARRVVTRKAPSNGQPEQAQPSLVREIAAFIRRYVVIEDEQLVVVALWVMHTWCAEKFEQTPYLSITSPEKQCGKSRLLEVLDMLVRKPWMAVLPSEAVVYRTIHAKRPTLLLDEVDTIFNPRTADRYEALRAMLNAGHRNGATVPRCIAGGERMVEFRVYCPKVLAGIGTLPDTVADRSIPVRLQRKTRDEVVDRFFRRDVLEIADPLRERIENWVDAHSGALGLARPDLPDELSDRMQEGCEPLLAIADAIGEGEAARRALVKLFGQTRQDSAETMRLRLLRDLRTVFEMARMPRALATETILLALTTRPEFEEAPWGGRYYGRDLDAADLASLLRHYDVHPKASRCKGFPQTKRGYARDDLKPVWERYVAETPPDA